MNGPRRLVLSLVPLALMLAGCPSSSSTPPRVQSPDGMTCAQRLVGGAWRFTGFQPDQPLDAQSAATLEQLHGSIRLMFDGQRATTTIQGAPHVGPYQVDSDDGISCRVIAPDDTGVVSETYVRFVGSPHRIEVIDRRGAVPGRSTMERGPLGS